MLTKKEFDILTFLESDNTKHTQRAIAQKTDMSLGCVNNTLSQLIEKNYIDEKRKLSECGKEALIPYRAKKAILLAADFKQRMLPLTLNTPKPLIRVHATRIIDSILDALVEAEIDDIVVVTGHFSEQFDQLLYDYPNIRLIKNPLYNQTNTLSSIYLVRDQLENAYVINADLIIRRKKLLTKYQYQTNFLGSLTEETDYLCAHTNRHIITHLTQGGKHCHRLYGLSYWKEEDAKRLSKDIEKIYLAPGGREKTFEEVALQHGAQSYHATIRDCSNQDILYIDTYEQLKKIDNAYS